MLAIMFRLSLVAGGGYGLFDAYRNFEAWGDARLSYAMHKARLDCAAKLSDDWLSKNTNEFGNIDVAPVCGVGESGATFFTNADEIRQARAGEDVFGFLLWRKPYDLRKSAFAFLEAFILVNLIGAALIGLYRITRWVVAG